MPAPFTHLQPTGVMGRRYSFIAKSAASVVNVICLADWALNVAILDDAALHVAVLDTVDLKVAVLDDVALEC